MSNSFLLKLSYLVAIWLVAVSAALGLTTQGKDQFPTVNKSSEELFQSIREWQEPVYPPIARVARAGGPIEIDLMIDERGNVSAARAVSGHPLLQAPAVQAARNWKFKPITVNGRPARVTGRIIYNYPTPDATTKEKSIHELERKASMNPTSANAHYELGRSYFELQRYSEAVKEFLAATRLDSKMADAYLNLGHAYSHNRSFDEAIDAYKKASELDPERAEPLHAIGLCLMYQDKFEDAIVFFKRSLELEPIIASYFMIGKSHLLLGRSRQAVESYKQGLTKHPTSDIGHFGLGEAYMNLEQYADAIVEFKEALRLSEGPGVTNTHYHLGLAYIRSGDRESALKEYEVLKERKSDLAGRLWQEIQLLKPREIGD